MMKYKLLFLLLFLSTRSFGQLNEDFSDGDFTSNPEWSGDQEYFEVTNEQLHSIGPSESSQLYLATPNTGLNYTTWEFLIDLQFAPSGSNKIRTYLVSDEINLEADLQGYFIEIGQSGSDEIKFYRQDGNSTSLLFTGNSQLSGNVKIRLKVSRDAGGVWTIWADVAGDSNFLSEGDSFTDYTYTTTSYFGFVCFHTSTRADLFYIDEVSISAEDPPFDVISASVQSNNSVLVEFNQSLDQSSAENKSNYSVDYGYGTPQIAEVINSNEVLLTYDQDFVNNDYQLGISNVHNLDKDETITFEQVLFAVVTKTNFRQIVINEIYADFNPSAVGIPNEEYLELLNISDQAINIDGFEINGNSIDGHVIPVGEFLIMTDDSNVDLFVDFGEVVSVSSFPTLTNSGLALTLHDNLGNIVDSLTYDLEWYHDEDKKKGGYALEQINPKTACNYRQNWSVSNSEAGGTPGIQNSIFDDSPDTLNPELTIMTIIDSVTIELSFNEPMNEHTLVSGIYSLDPNVPMQQVKPYGYGFQNVSIDLSEALVSETWYQLLISEVSDCAGNEISPSSEFFWFDNQPPVLERLEVLTDKELLLHFDENLNSNIAEKEEYFQLEANAVDKSESVDSTIIFLEFEESFAPEVEYVLSISNLEDTLGNALTTPIEFGFIYKLALDTIFVLSPNHLRIVYMENVQLVPALKDKNYEINREVGWPVSVYQSSTNERIFNLVFQKDFPENKELILTIQNILKLDGDYLSTPQQVFIYDTAPPKLDTLIVETENSLNVVFNEQVDRESAESRVHYEYRDLYPVSAQLLADSRSVQLIFEGDFDPEVEYDLLIDEIMDLYGNKVSNRIKAPFIFDEIPPRIDSVCIKSPTELRIIFHEHVSLASAEKVLNYYHEILGNPTSAILDLESLKSVILKFDKELLEANQQLRISNISDIRGNLMKDTQDIRFDHTKLMLGELVVLNEQELQVSFTKPVDSVEAIKPENYSINDLMPISVEFEGLTATLEFEDAFLDKNSYELVLQPMGIQELGQPNYAFTFDSHLESVVLLNLETVELTFTQNLKVDHLLNLEEYVLHPHLVNPISAIISSEETNTIRLIFEESMLPNEFYSIKWSRLENEFGNWIPSYSSSFQLDSMAPMVVNHKVFGDRQLVLKFNESLQELSAVFGPNYSLNEAVGHPEEVAYNKNDSTVILDFENSFQEGLEYELIVNGVKDLTGNIMNDIAIKFNYEAPYDAQFGDLIITEIMASPNDDQSEFFELYNSSDELVQLEGLTFVDNSSTAYFTSGELGPKQYIVVSPEQQSFETLNTGKLSKWLALNNGGEMLSIYNGEQLIFSVNYQESWYGFDEKGEGGFSLEMVDLNNPCGASNNWSASDKTGGTPGESNSIKASNPDNLSPEIISVFAETANVVCVQLSEKVRPQEDLVDYITIAPSVVVYGAELNGPINNQIKIELGQELQSGKTYQITIDRIADCVSNSMDENVPLGIVLPESASSGDIIINEVLFNPRSGGVDFVEIYNHSEKVIDLKGWYLADAAAEVKTITNNHFLIHSGEYLALTSDQEILSSDYPNGNIDRYFETNNFPALNDDQDSVLLLDVSRSIINAMWYEEDYHFGLLSSEEGVSLERISFDAPVDRSDTWQSAASTSGFATPGMKNSQQMNSSLGHGTISIQPKVFFPDQTGKEDFTTISYELQQVGNFANVQVYGSAGRIIKRLAENELLSSKGFFTWDGVTDSGSLANVGYYIVYFEIYDATGNKKVYKETVALGTRF